MSLNPLREALGSLGLRAAEAETRFKQVADAALTGFRTLRGDLERRVAKGEITVKVAREEAGTAAARLQHLLAIQSDGFSVAPKLFQDRLLVALARREASRQRRSVEELQRETNQLLKQALVEQQIQARVAEFEGQTYRRPMTGGTPTTSLDALLRFHQNAALSRDEVATEWCRRQLEGIRDRTFSDEERFQIDRACDRPDRVDPRLAASYVEMLGERSADELEVFVTEALEQQDATRCVAAFILARKDAQGTEARWVRRTIDAVDRFPDAALTHLRAWEAEARQAEGAAARAQADFASAVASTEAALSNVRPPSESDLIRQSRIDALPAARLGEPIGLTLQRRGLSPEEFVEHSAADAPFGEDAEDPFAPESA